ncbi:hypothetical protein PsYK624_121680 [Phanerochaete sordida]|uniref:Alpha/beta-hydrolase n=1 Tax=Phanerochaete sordida TaxID=48140 RepID=A0A9P3GIY1_9APHY|nr:hypothetical protein PsYK624_121680 [Phanerochaete sordida]
MSLSSSFNWLSLNASTSLAWTPCYDAFQCARLSVPLYYSDPSAGSAAIALIKSPSNFSAGSAEYLGPILFNPGGPGGSGVELVLAGAPYFRAIIGAQYDLVGFDPRGVGATTPPLSIFNSPPEALEWYAGYPQNVNESVSSFGRGHAAANILGSLAADRASVEAQAVSTPAVAHDMLSIARAFGFERVNYWGVSYGSVIGATFAAMFPQNVGRFIIDGVVNAHEWYAGVDTSSLLDADAALSSVWSACTAAGPSNCPLYASDPAAIAKRVNALVDAVHLAPVPVFNGSSQITFGVMDYTALVHQLYTLAQHPYADGAQIVAGLSALARGDASLIYQGSDAQAVSALATCAFDAGAPFADGSLDVTFAIAGGDQLRTGTLSLEQARANYALLVKQSAFFAPDLWATLQGGGSGWTLRGKDRFNGSFATQTSTPVLLIGNTFDPLTPLANAHNMSAGFARSVVLQQNSTGHSSWTGFSTCTARAVHAYFASGALPARGTVCQPDFAIFAPANGTTSLERRGDGEVAFDAAVRAIALGDFVARRRRGARAF